MTADSEAMTLALAEAFRLGKIHRENQFYEHAGDTGERFEKLVADTVAHLSCAAEPVGELVRLGSSPYTGEYGSVFWRDNTPPPCGTKLYTHQSEDARDSSRLDWLAAHPRLSTIVVNGVPAECYFYGVAGAMGLKLREVIDAAMKGDGNAT